MKSVNANKNGPVPSLQEELEVANQKFGLCAIVSYISIGTPERCDDWGKRKIYY